MKINFLPILAGAAQGVGQNLQQQQLERLRQAAFNRQMQGQRDIMGESARIRQGEIEGERTYRQNEEKRQRDELNALFLKAQSGQPLTPFEKQTYDSYLYNQKMQALKLQGEEAGLAHTQKATSLLGRGSGGRGGPTPEETYQQNMIGIGNALREIDFDDGLSPEEKLRRKIGLMNDAAATPGMDRRAIDYFSGVVKKEYEDAQPKPAPTPPARTPFFKSFAPAPDAPIVRLSEGSRSIINKSPAFRIGKWGAQKAKESGKWLWGK